ncbi:UvrD-helicase domain-containing protein [Duganella radicis]|uniref:DNA 3'-5' helicase II n=1 Tax=Duganella radicis TaxID=551988 RepID=A0A6L6PG31_9BURK|nr:UvrD-helicase domain-containing protein [Duganella radicis]MTV37537.1 AAA family ATPase [Duganella radicis]
MTLPVITQEDLDALATLAADLQFADAERRAVLLEGNSRDINAAPGSGKTTILAAKLLLLSRKWPHARRGICVLSHTNIARDEIRQRLARSSEGARLLSYPHFIGTIHAFVNQFLALPYLRSVGIGVDVIDDDAFAQRALRKAKANGSLRYSMEQNQGVASKVAGLIYQGPDLQLASEGGSLPKPTSKTYPVMSEIKEELAQQGVFRYADMFAYAERLLRHHPSLIDRLTLRFPCVFMDEMQDTSWQQEQLLQQIFAGRSIVQRYGDVNQRILTQDNGAEFLTFPQPTALPISVSKRFGPQIASAVAGVQLAGTPVTGERADVRAPLLILYATERVEHVIPTFGRRVLELFEDAELRDGLVKAMCTRKQGDAKASPGRHLGDYWPASAGDAANDSNRPERFWALLSHASATARSKGTFANSAMEVRRAILLVLRSARAPAIADVRDAPQLIRQLLHAEHDVMPLRRLVRELLIRKADYSRPAERGAVPALVFQYLQPLLPPTMRLDAFSQLEVFAEPAYSVEIQGTEQYQCTVVHEQRQVTIPIGTVASMKGETHLATLVLESHGGNSQRFDLEEALKVLVGQSAPPTQKLLMGQFRNLYVAMSRPTSFLCIGANVDRVSAQSQDLLRAKGWNIEHL